MTALMNWKFFLVLGLISVGYARVACAQDANQIVRQAVQAELAASKADQSRWRYRDAEEDKGLLSIVVQTDAGSVKRLIARNGKPISAEEAQQQQAKVEVFVHDSSALAKQKKDAAADETSATELMLMLPEAFTWRIAGEDAHSWRLEFVPNPNFHPPDMQARVLGEMGGELVVDKEQHRIETISGRLTEDVMIGFGLLGRLKQGGTFRVERREIKPGLWQITETHVHIDGKALLFKSIGQQQDEVQTDFTQVPGATTLEQAVVLSEPRK